MKNLFYSTCSNFFEGSSSSVVLEEYYAVYYDQNYYIGRAIEQKGDQLKFKFLHRNRCGFEAQYDWPRRPDIDSVHRRYIIYGPIKLVGNGPFCVHENDISRIKSVHKDMQRRLTFAMHEN